MSWTMYRWVWRVATPFHVGWLPAGALNRTRLYVPARALWGALTAELARRGSAAFPNYAQIGQRLQRDVRFSYLFPAEKVEEQWLAWLPMYEKGKGLVWQREDGNGKASDRVFRQWLLITQLGTAIDHASQTAWEGTLREFELISPWWRKNKEEGSFSPVGMMGFVFFKDKNLESEVQEVKELFIGGETHYGLGRLVQEAMEPASSFFASEKVTLSFGNPVVNPSHLLAHTKPYEFEATGAMEYVMSWDMVTGGMLNYGLLWIPGSRVSSKKRFAINQIGYWEPSH